MLVGLILEHRARDESIIVGVRTATLIKVVMLTCCVKCTRVVSTPNLFLMVHELHVHSRRHNTISKNHDCSYKTHLKMNRARHSNYAANVKWESFIFLRLLKLEQS